MTNQPDNVLTPIEFAILARLSQPTGATPPTDTELGQLLTWLKLARKEDVHSELRPALESLKKRELALIVPPSKRARVRRWAQTERGARLLRDILNLPRPPMWKALFENYLPALELGLITNADPNHVQPGNLDAMSLAIVASHLHTPTQRSATALCDTLIAEELKLPTPLKEGLTISGIRVWVLHQRLQRAGLEFRESIRTTKELEKLPRKLAAKLLNVSKVDRSVFLGRLRTQALQKVVKLGIQNSGRITDLQPHAATGASDHTLLTAVREAIPRVGSNGRHGPEKVFVSELWRSIEGDLRLGDLSFDKFKRWLIEANRRRVLDLARADHVPAMDGKLVAESEISDFGATFHFVLDRQADRSGANKGFHARKA